MTGNGLRTPGLVPNGPSNPWLCYKWASDPPGLAQNGQPTPVDRPQMASDPLDRPQTYPRPHWISPKLAAHPLDRPQMASDPLRRPQTDPRPPGLAPNCPSTPLDRLQMDPASPHSHRLLGWSESPGNGHQTYSRTLWNQGRNNISPPILRLKPEN